MAISEKKTRRVFKVNYFEKNHLPSDFNVGVGGVDVEILKHLNSRNSIYQTQGFNGVFYSFQLADSRYYDARRAELDL